MFMNIIVNDSGKEDYKTHYTYALSVFHSPCLLDNGLCNRIAILLTVINFVINIIAIDKSSFLFTNTLCSLHN